MKAQMSKDDVGKVDYMYCETCECLFDLWKYDNLDEAGHGFCETRPITDEEFKVAKEGCISAGCFDEGEGSQEH